MASTTYYGPGQNAQNPYGKYGYGPQQGPQGFPPFGGSIPGSILGQQQGFQAQPYFQWNYSYQSQAGGDTYTGTLKGTQEEIDAFRNKYGANSILDIKSLGDTSANQQLSQDRSIGRSTQSVRDTQKILDQARFEDLTYRQAQEAAIYGQMQAIRQGFGRARSQLNRFSGHGYQVAEDTAAQARAQLRNDLTSRGLGQTTALVQADVQSAGTKIRLMQEHDARMAQLYSNLEIDQARGEVANMQELVSLYGETSRSQTGFLMEDFFWRTGRYTGGEDKAGPDNSGQIWGAVGAAIGAWLAA